MFDRLRSKEAATISTVLALGLGMTACGSSSSTEGNTQINQPVTTVGNTVSESSLPDSGNTISAQYYNDGTREISFGNSSLPSIFEFCDGPDLVEETEVMAVGASEYDPGGAGGGDISRIFHAPVCSDGKLIPGDF